MTPSSVASALDELGMATKVGRYTEDPRHELKPWLVQMALERLGDRRLSEEEQVVVLGATHAPQLVHWPHWWTIRP